MQKYTYIPIQTQNEDDKDIYSLYIYCVKLHV